MANWWWQEHMLVVLLVYVLLRILWQQHRQPAKKRKKKGKRSQWQPKSPKDCPACREGVKLSLFRVQQMWGRYTHLLQQLRELGLSGTIQTAFIERLNLTIRQGIAALSRRPWSKARSNVLYLHVQWWRCSYHLAREHKTLRVCIPGLRRRYRPRSPAMAAGINDHLWSVRDILHLPVMAQGGAC